MSLPNEERTAPALNTTAKSGSRKADGRPRSVHPCDFRSAGRLSNENARFLTALHETFARRVVSALDAHLGTGLAIKLLALQQLPIEEHNASIPPLSYSVPCSLAPMPTTMILECGLDL